MKTLLRSLLLAALVFGAFALQQPQPKEIPIYEGDSNPQHDGQPKFCQNYDTPKFLHNCTCKEMNPSKCHEPEQDGEEGGGESSKCRVFCRKSACSCTKGCDTE